MSEKADLNGIRISTTAEDADWQKVSDILKDAGLSQLDAAGQKKAFMNSYAVAFAYDGNDLVGVGRELSDGISQAVIYNIALEEKYRGREIGRAIIESLIGQVPGCTVILYTHPRTVAMYEHMGFRRFKTALIYFGDGENEHHEFMEEKGFILPEHYRFNDNEYEKIPYDPELKISLDKA
jgi:ribosomal protein S18 acetylase RimI-like enzyme